MSYSIKQVLIIRNDLNMRKGKMVAQGAHAAMMFLLYEEESSSQVVQDWFVKGMAKICVRADSEEHLRQLHDSAKAAGLLSHIVTDAGHTEFHGVPTQTALAIGPGDSATIDLITSSLKLL